MAYMGSLCILLSKMNTRRKYFYYKGIKVNAFGIPVSSKSKKISRIKKNRNAYNFSFDSPFQKDSPKDLIVMYDIPHSLKKERDWFRRHLKKFNYIMIQKSVWVGPSPLPKDFLNYVKEIGLNGQLKTFRLARSYLNKIDNTQ